MNEMIRLWRSPQSNPGRPFPDSDPRQDEACTAIAAYSDAELKTIADAGFNAIWVHGNLHHLVKTDIFPELGEMAGMQQRNLNELIARAGRHQLQVFLYCQPLQAISRRDPFWQDHPEVGGQQETINDEQGESHEFQALCTSAPQVKIFLVQAGAELSRKLPGLGGVIIVTAPELPSHCWSLRGRLTRTADGIEFSRITCPRCSGRPPGTVISEIVRLIRHGIRTESTAIKIVASAQNWTFYEPSPCSSIITALPRDVILMLDFDIGGRKKIAGQERPVEDFALTFSGPSTSFFDSLEVAARCGLNVFTRLQIGTTHELATVPNLPLIGNLFTKAEIVRRLLLSGFIGDAAFPGAITLNTAAINAFTSERLPEKRDDALIAFAAEYFPGCEPQKVVEAWLKFAEATDHYPLSHAFLHYGPTNFPFVLPSERNIDMDEALSQYKTDELIAVFERTVELWQKAEEIFLAAVAACTDHHAEEEINTVRICGLSFRSTANFLKIYRLRRGRHPDHHPAYREVVADELQVLTEALPLLERDPRFGYHGATRTRIYDAPRLQARIDELIKQLSP